MIFPPKNKNPNNFRVFDERLNLKCSIKQEASTQLGYYSITGTETFYSGLIGVGVLWSVGSMVLKPIDHLMN